MSIAKGDFLIDQVYKSGTGVNKIYKGTDLVYDRSLKNKFEYFYVYANGGTDRGVVGSVSLENNGDNAPNLEYSYDGITWTTWDYSSLDLVGPSTSEESSPIYSFIFFRGNNPNGFSQSLSVYSRFLIIDNIYNTAYIHVGGNIMSLLYKDSFWKEDETPNNTIPNDYCFYRLFYQNNIRSCLGGPGSWIDDKQQVHALYPLRLPATVLTLHCYENMFGSTRQLKEGPLILPALTLKKWCYQNMFNGSSIDKAPLLPAPVLVDYCYYMMFLWCNTLNYIKTYANNISATGCMISWLQSTSSTGTFVKKRGVTYPTGTDGIPSGWTVEEID